MNVCVCVCVLGGVFVLRWFVLCSWVCAGVCVRVRACVFARVYACVFV